jgi:hypothetical protein
VLITISSSSFFLNFVCISIFETEEIEAIASHLNQKVKTLYKSSRVFIFEVEYFSQINFKSSSSIPNQSSLIIIFFVHQSKISTFIFVALASIEFSTSSFTTEAGLSTTSQAAI